jgi:hypothetical protein
MYVNLLQTETLVRDETTTGIYSLFCNLDSDTASVSLSWSLRDVHAVLDRRYNLVRCALELMFSDHRSVYFTFADEKKRASFQELLKKRLLQRPDSIRTPELARALDDGMSLQMFRCMRFQYEGKSPADIFKRSKLSLAWQHRYISNFDYLMHLNMMAGRSFHDMSQYPVFPWVLADYSSSKIDLNNKEVYRDLSQPIGALNPHRHKKFQDQYEMMEQNCKDYEKELTDLKQKQDRCAQAIAAAIKVS